MPTIDKSPTPSADKDCLDLYWREIKDNKPLSREEECDLFARFRAGDRAAYEQLIQANLRFVVRVAREYCPEDGPLLMDLIAEGNMGLLHAIDRYDETRGFKFITYAVWWIRQAILKAAPRAKRAARVPMSHVNDMHTVEKEMAVLSQRLGRAATFAEVAAVTEMSPERMVNALAAGKQDMSLDAPVFEDEDQPLYAAFPIDDTGFRALEEERVMQSLARGLETLDEREGWIIREYFGLDREEGRTLEEIGADMGITRERVRQLRNRALGKMRALFDEWQVEISAN
jgi:RNA polymerase primary sigma factor